MEFGRVPHFIWFQFSPCLFPPGDLNPGAGQVKMNLVGICPQPLASKQLEESPDLDVHEDTILRLANNVEKEIFNLFLCVDQRYKNKYRSLLFNLKAPKNKLLFHQVVLGEVSPQCLVQMNSLELAPKELAEWRAKESKHVLEVIEKQQREPPRSCPTKLTHKGEIEIHREVDEDFTLEDLYVSRCPCLTKQTQQGSFMGCILPEDVWDYLESIWPAEAKEISMIRFCPAMTKDFSTYNMLYSYLNNKQRYGIVDSNQMEMFMVPLPAFQPVPAKFHPLGGPGMDLKQTVTFKNNLVTRCFSPPLDSSGSTKLAEPFQQVNHGPLSSCSLCSHECGGNVALDANVLSIQQLSSILYPGVASAGGVSQVPSVPHLVSNEPSATSDLQNHTATGDSNPTIPVEEALSLIQHLEALVQLNSQIQNQTLFPLPSLDLSAILQATAPGESQIVGGSTFPPVQQESGVYLQSQLTLPPFCEPVYPPSGC
uniref:TFIIS central domain-containing protein n=1 Tax=Chrysemys picta bellii TaxID=8478 RepID=A0A8C3I249_CHRPI